MEYVLTATARRIAKNQIAMRRQAMNILVKIVSKRGGTETHDMPMNYQNRTNLLTHTQ